MAEKRMRTAQATDATFGKLVASGTVVVAFYTSSCAGYEDTELKKQEPGAARRRRRRRLGDIRRALKHAAWEHNRKLRVVFVEYEECRVTCHILGIIGFATFWILKDGARLAELSSMVQGGHRDSYRLARERFTGWLRQHLFS